MSWWGGLGYDGCPQRRELRYWPLLCASAIINVKENGLAGLLSEWTAGGYGPAPGFKCRAVVLNNEVPAHAGFFNQLSAIKHALDHISLEDI